jgi:hypothetical protein
MPFPEGAATWQFNARTCNLSIETDRHGFFQKAQENLRFANKTIADLHLQIEELYMRDPDTIIHGVLHRKYPQLAEQTPMLVRTANGPSYPESLSTFYLLFSFLGETRYNILQLLLRLPSWGKVKQRWILVFIEYQLFLTVN